MITILRTKVSSLGASNRNILFFTLEGIVAAIILNLYNPFLSIFAIRMGASDFQVGLISSLPSLAGIIVLIPGSIIVDRLQSKKSTVRFLLLVSGLILPLAALTPYLGSYSVAAYILVIALLNWPLSIFNITWQSYFSDVFSDDLRNSAYSIRSTTSVILGTLTTLAAGFALSYIPKSEGQRIHIYQLFFLSAFLLSILQRWFLGKVDYRSSCKYPREASSSNLLEAFKALYRNKKFMSFTIIVFIFHISWQMAWPLFTIYQVNYLHANESWLSLFIIAFNLSSAFTYPLWSRSIKKKGARWIIVIGALGLSANALFISNINSLIVLLVFNAFIGLTFSAFQLALFENLMEVVPNENKTLNIAIYTTFVNISGFVSPLLGIAIYKFTSIHFAMTLAGVLRLIITIIFAFMAWRHNKSGIPTSKAEYTA